jgi:serine/threonine protein kinase/Flp pilus assembly protein TadD
MVAAWTRGEAIRAEEFLERYPELRTEDAVRLVYEEVCLRREAGQEVQTAEVISRFPHWKDELEILLGCDRLLRPLARPAILPEIGEQLGPFHLVDELGRGASGKTYLAVDRVLADRLVVLKVISDDQEEHLSLARLQHTHIIPLFSEQPFPDRGVRALCMPYLGGTSLAMLLEALDRVPIDNRLGRHLLEALDRIQADRPAPPPSADGPYRRYLEQATYVQAICWIVACLAEGLHEAHLHGLIHMDVKPSNVLIAGDGMPMLLDFHLARRPLQLGERVPDRIGGTPGWMAPEQDAALKAASQGRPVPGPVDHRADLYALGLLLCEALGGPDAVKHIHSGRTWSHLGAEASIGLVDIARKCLAVKSSDRYRDAASLAEDLRRHLNDLPLRGVPNRSLAERWRKWRRRQPAALARSIAWSVALGALMLAVTLGRAFFHQRVQEVQVDLEDGRKFRSEHRFAEAVRVLDRGLKRAAVSPAPSSLTGALNLELRLAKRGQGVTELHRLADRVRFHYGIQMPTGEEASKLVRSIQRIWEEREFLLDTDPGSLGPEIEEEARRDLLELAMVWADLQVRLAPRNQADDARQEARRILDRAASVCGSSPALERERRAYTFDTARPVPADAMDPAPGSAWDHYNLGRSHLRQGQIQEAELEFQRTLELRPQDFWPNFYQGLCAYELGRFEDAVAAFRTCIALTPRSAECYYNRARAADALGRPQQAISDYGHALALDPTLSEAALNRGVIFYNLKRYDEAISDLERALQTDPGADRTGLIHFNLALAHHARGEHSEAMKQAEEALARGYQEAGTLRDLLRSGR